MDGRRRIRLILGGLAGTALVVALFPWDTDPIVPKLTAPEIFVAPPPPSEEDQAAALELQLDALRAARNAAQGVIDRAARGEPVPPEELAKARIDVQALIEQIEALE
jgi:hypothetical protein